MLALYTSTTCCAFCTASFLLLMMSLASLVAPYDYKLPILTILLTVHIKSTERGYNAAASQSSNPCHANFYRPPETFGTLTRFPASRCPCEGTAIGKLPIQLQDSSGFPPDSPKCFLFFTFINQMTAASSRRCSDDMVRTDEYFPSHK